MVVNRDYLDEQLNLIPDLRECTIGKRISPDNSIVRCFDMQFARALSKLLYDRLRLCRHMRNYESHRLIPRSALGGHGAVADRNRAGVACGRRRLTLSRHLR